MKADEKKPTPSVATAKPVNGSQVLTPNADKEAATKKEVKPGNAIEQILNDLEVLNSRSENRSFLMETLKKLKGFNPTVTESRCELIIKDRQSEFRTTATEPMKMIIGNYIAIVETKLREVEGDIAHLASKLAS
jgi:hypothetical protein